MDQNSLLTVLTWFVGLATVAMLVQAGMLVRIFLLSKRTHEKLAAILPKANDVLDNASRTLTETRKHVSDIGARTTEILDITKSQLEKIDKLVDDASARARVQMDRAELVLDDSMTRAQDTVILVQRGIIKPIREVHGVLTGIRAALSYFSRSGRPPVDHVTADEEMFI